MHLRDYQAAAVHGVLAHPETSPVVVLPTGAGKTVILADLVHRWWQAGERVVLVAHRRELVGQISLALARAGVPHRVDGPAAKDAVRTHMREGLRSHVNPLSPILVAGVDRVAAQTWPADALVGRVCFDEAHHVLRLNKWGRAAAKYPNARFLGVTATPNRADGKGIGRMAAGLFDRLIIGPGMRELIQRGHLSDYRIFAPPSRVDLSGVAHGADGDYVQIQAARAVERAHIHGDVVEHYLRHAAGKRGITFAPSIKVAEEFLAAFRAAGVPCALLTGKTDPSRRAEVLREFREGSILQLVNVDLFGEGFDLPSLEVVSMATPTESFGKYCQQFGRALRMAEGKGRAIIIDHVGNVRRLGLPDAPQKWTLEGRKKRSNRQRETLVKVCPSCASAYPPFVRPCPYCGYAPPPGVRSDPASVEGDLEELDVSTLLRLRNAATELPKIPHGAAPEVVGAILKRHRAKLALRNDLGAAIAGWMATNHPTAGPGEAQRAFWHVFGIDVLTARTLGTAETRELLERVNG